MFWYHLAKTNFRAIKEKFLDKILSPLEYNVNKSANLFKQASELVLDFSHIVFDKMNESQKSVITWVKNSKGYIGFESYFFGEYVKEFVEKYKNTTFEAWQIEDGMYLKEFFSQHPEEYDKWVTLAKDLYTHVKKISDKDIDTFIKNHEQFKKVFNSNLKEREEEFNQIKTLIWEKTFNYLKTFYIF